MDLWLLHQLQPAASVDGVLIGNLGGLTSKLVRKPMLAGDSPGA